ncbi:MAG: indole-3-glycerol phosphate synthase TrpC [Flavobacteriales bacterium]|nr:indole-3-glycerol phosphate synthase TrpC [Flavobacteriales bacterium]
MTMLQEIIENKRKKVEQQKQLYPTKLLEQSIYFDSKCVSLSHYLTRKDKSGIIAEFKRKSPSKGVINAYADVLETTLGYMQAGASALSVLTEQDYFMGKSEDLTIARNANYCPILRKDFTVDEYQIIEAKSIGADAILLIAAALEKDQIKNLHQLAKSLGLEVLFEIHGKDELDKVPDSDLIIGVNNRNLKTMEVDLKTSFDIINELPKTSLLISESGLSNVEDVKQLKEAGYQGFLMGEHFMRTPNPAEALKQFITKLNAL